MNYFLIMAEVLTLLLLSSMIGRRIVALLPFKPQAVLRFYVSPILGVAVLVLLSTLYGWLFPFKTLYTLLTTGVVFILVCVLERKWGQLFKEWLQISVFALICSLPILAPIIHSHGFNPFTDIFTYLAQSQWLQAHSFAHQALASGYYPYVSQITLYQNSGSRMGGSFLLAYVQSLFGMQWSYYAYIPTLSLGFTSGCLALGGIIRQLLPLKKWIVLALALIPCFTMNGFLFGAEWGFYPQTIGLGLAAGLAAIFPVLTQSILKSTPRCGRLLVQVLPASLCTVALLFAYNEPFLIFTAALGLFFMVTVIVVKGRLISMLQFFGIYFVEVLLFINYEAIRMAKNLLQTITLSKGVAFGWPVLWPPIHFLAYAFGLKSPFGNSLAHAHHYISTYLFSFLFILLIVILIKFMRTRTFIQNLTLYFLICIDLLLLLAFIKFRYFSINITPAEIGHTFLQFKIAKYAAPFSLALVGIGFGIMWLYFKKWRISFVGAYGAALLIGLHIQCHSVSAMLTQNFLDETKSSKYPFETLLKLREAVSHIPKDEVIYVALGPVHSKLRQMVAYVLYDRKIAGDYSDDGYILGHLPLNERVMKPNIASWLLMMADTGKKGDRTQVIGEVFRIQAAPFSKAILHNISMKGHPG